MSTQNGVAQRKKAFHEGTSKCMCFNLRKASRVITQIYDEAIRSTGYRSTQMTLLAAVMSMEPATVNDLAECVVTDRTTLTRNLKPLEKQGLLKVRVGDDRRERVVVLTEKGHKLMEKTIPLLQKTAEKVNQVVGDDRMERLLKDLNVALAAVKEK